MELEEPLTPVEEEDIQQLEEEELVEIDVEISVPRIKERLQKVLLDADEITFEEELESITEYVPVAESQKRYGIETQANDLLDEMLSTIPSADRNSKVLNQIHMMIERFKQLRKMFSIISSDGVILKPKTKGANFKPLVEKLETLNQNLYWLLPIARNKRKLYDIVLDEEDDTSDIIQLTLSGSQNYINEVIDQYQQNINTRWTK